MKQALTILTLILAFLWQSCIHTYPDDNAEDPTTVEIAVDLTLNLKWSQLLSFYPQTKSADVAHRFIIEISTQGKTPFRHEQIIDQEDFDDGFVRIPLPVTLKPIVYSISVWCDAIDPETSEPLAFDANTLSSISPLHPHEKPSLIEGCGFAASSIDLTPYGNKLSTRLIIPLELTPPVARFQFNTTDVNKFLNYADQAIQKGETYSVTLSFDNSIPSTFNAITGEPTGHDKPVEVSSQLPALFSQEIKICSDWIFAAEEKEDMTVTITLFNSARMIVSRIRGITFPIERGKTTTVKGDFLTNFYSNSISVDNLWDDEIIINLD